MKQLRKNYDSSFKSKAIDLINERANITELT